MKMMSPDEAKTEVVYFELNNWFSDTFYPNEEPFTSWLGDDLNQFFLNESWVKENELCVNAYFIDMSLNYCITAPRSWVLKNCPNLFSFTKFLRFPDENGKVFGRTAAYLDLKGDVHIEEPEFLEYNRDNIGVHLLDFDYDN